MAQKLDSVSCGTDYTDAATITDVYGCRGGYFAIVGNDAFIQVQYGALGGGTQWSDEFHAPVGNGQLTEGTIGVRFRNYVAGNVAVVSAGLFYPRQPWFALSSGGNANPPAATAVTGTIPMLGTTPTSGTGFTYTHTNGTGSYVFTFAAGSFATAPTVVVTPIGSTSGGNFPVVRLPAVATASGFSVDTFARAGGAEDCAFSFIAETTV